MSRFSSHSRRIPSVAVFESLVRCSRREGDCIVAGLNLSSQFRKRDCEIPLFDRVA
jgi:hypothetical protein